MLLLFCIVTGTSLFDAEVQKMQNGPRKSLNGTIPTDRTGIRGSYTSSRLSLNSDATCLASCEAALSSWDDKTTLCTAACTANCPYEMNNYISVLRQKAAASAAKVCEKATTGSTCQSTCESELGADTDRAYCEAACSAESGQCASTVTSAILQAATGTDSDNDYSLAYGLCNRVNMEIAKVECAETTCKDFIDANPDTAGKACVAICAARKDGYGPLYYGHVEACKSSARTALSDSEITITEEQANQICEAVLPASPVCSSLCGPFTNNGEATPASQTCLALCSSTKDVGYYDQDECISSLEVYKSQYSKDTTSLEEQQVCDALTSLFSCGDECYIKFHDRKDALSACRQLCAANDYEDNSECKTETAKLPESGLDYTEICNTVYPPDQCSDTFLNQFAKDYPKYVSYAKTVCACQKKAKTEEEYDTCKYEQNGEVCILSPADALSDIPGKTYSCGTGEYVIEGETFDGKKNDAGVETVGTKVAVKKCTFTGLSSKCIDSVPRTNDKKEVVTVGYLGVSECKFSECTTRCISSCTETTIRYCTFNKCVSHGALIKFESDYACSVSNTNFTECKNTEDAPICIKAEVSNKLIIARCFFFKCSAIGEPVTIKIVLDSSSSKENAVSMGSLELSNCAFQGNYQGNDESTAATTQDVAIGTSGGVTASSAIKIEACYVDKEASVSFDVPAAVEAQVTASVKKTDKPAESAGVSEDAGINLTYGADTTEPDDDGFPVWAIVLIVVLSVLVVAAIVIVVVICLVRKKSA